MTAAVLTTAAVGPLALLTSSPATAAPSAAKATASRLDRTSPLEARRVDRVKLGKIQWHPCTDTGGECALIRLPMDYDQPNGPTTEVAVARIKAAKPSQRIGALFLNPGGPGGSAANLALAGDAFLDQQILDRFDIVGVDPRGIANGDRVTCFRTAAEQRAAIAGFGEGIPVTRAETKRFIQAARAQAKGCGTTGKPLAASMSTAEVARDMDVVRRALGDKTLSFFGSSYGTQIAAVYANMFPDRVRALVLDGVVDPVAWTTGRGDGEKVPVDGRLKTGEGSYLALRELMLRCDKAGAPACVFAGSGDSLKKFDVLAQRLKKKPLRTDAKTITYAGLVTTVLKLLFSDDPGPEVAALLEDFYTATDPVVIPSSRVAAGRRAVAAVAELRASLQPEQSTVRWPQRAGRADADYNFERDEVTSVLCSDSVNPRSPNAWIGAAKAAARDAPYYGAAWNWESAPCASSIWTARDEDRYMGPFTKRTARPALVVGSYYDPATPYKAGAVAASKVLFRSRLLSSNSWGHAAYGNNVCVSNAVTAYVLRGTLPAKGTICKGPQPFEPKTLAPQSTRRSGSTARPMPIRPYVPGLHN